MPATEQPNWVKDFRGQIKRQCKQGWLVAPDHGTMRLEVHDKEYGKKQRLSLPFKWSEDDWPEALLLIRQIANAYREGGLDLNAAYRVSQSSKIKIDLDWPNAIDGFRKERSRVSDRTWKQKYLPVMNQVIKLMSGRNKPTNGPDLCDLALSKWEVGTRQRQIMRQSLHGLLRYCVSRKSFKASWMPPVVDDKAVVTKKKRIGYPLTDSQIIRLLESLPDDEVSNKWKFACQLMAVFGLRPEDLRHLHTRNKGKELWSGYEKSKGGRKGETTEARRLYPLLVCDGDENIEWNLLARFQIKEPLPPLGQAGKAGESVGTYLRRKKIWKQLQQEAESEGQQLTAYSFRHRYSAECHARGLQPKQIADSMGHDLETHMNSYARFMSKDLESAFDAANKPKEKVAA